MAIRAAQIADSFIEDNRNLFRQMVLTWLSKQNPRIVVEHLESAPDPRRPWTIMRIRLEQPQEKSLIVKP